MNKRSMMHPVGTASRWRRGMAGVMVTLPIAAAGTVIGATMGATPAFAATTTTFNSTGSEQSYSVPTGVTAVTVTAVGAPGATVIGGQGGLGAAVTATVPVPSGVSTLYVEVGSAGVAPTCGSGTNAFNGGGLSGCGGGGGGASDVRTTPIATVADSALTTANDSRLVVAGGGGGGGYGAGCGASGGTAGDATGTGAGAGGAGSDPCDGAVRGGNGGFGGNVGGAGGAGTTAPYNCAGHDGALGVGGDGDVGCDSFNYGGAGGGGYYGGGAGGDGFNGGGGGGAGSSFWVDAASDTSMSEDTTGVAEVQITPVVTPADLAVAISDGNYSSANGKNLTYTIDVTNNGGSSATQVSATDALPATFMFKSMSTTQGSCTRTATSNPTNKGGTVTCDLGGLDGGASATITIVESPTKKGSVTDTASATANNVTADSDDSASVTTQL